MRLTIAVYLGLLGPVAGENSVGISVGVVGLVIMALPIGPGLVIST